MSRRSRVTLLALLIAAGAVLRFWGIGFGLPHDFSRPDEERITDAALGIFQGDLNPHFFLYPTFFIYLTAAADAVLFTIQRAIGTTASVADFVASATADPSSLHLTARILAASAGVATIAVVYAAGRELFASRAALAAAAFVAVAFLHVRDSHFGVTDVPVSLMAVCAFWVAVRGATRGVTLLRAASAGLLCGLAASTKYNAALVAAPVLVAMLCDAFERRDAFTRRLSAAIFVFASCLALGFLVGTPFALLDRPAFLADLDSQRRIVLGLQPGSILDPARQVYGGVRAWIHHASFNLRYGLGLPLLLTTVAGACWLAFRQPVRAALVLSFPLAYYASMGISLLAYARYMVPIVPFLCLVAGEAVDRAAQVLDRRLGARPAAAGAALLVILIGASTAAQAVAFDRLVATTDTRVLGAMWIQEHFPEGTTLYQTGTFYGHLQPRPASRYKVDAFDDRHARFLVDGQPAPALPELVVVLDSPLVIYNHVPERLGAVLDAHYRLVSTFQGIAAPAAAQALYDQQDAFYVPFANPQGIRRPGPGVRIFQRRPAQ